MTKCKRKTCYELVDRPDRLYCKKCRARAYEHSRKWQLTHPVERRVRNREHLKKYRLSKTPKALAYVERSKIVNTRCSVAWAAAHRDRKNLIQKLRKAIEAGEITRPSTCNDCCKRVKPVAWGLHQARDGSPVVRAWCCWGCWWRRKRGEGPPGGALPGDD